MNNAATIGYESTLQSKLDSDLNARVMVFDELTTQFECQRPSPLIAVYQIPDRVDEQEDSQGGFKHPSNLLVKELA
ncbi:MAG: hypothetical protein HN996_04585 [Opitutae bacterium]|nr:hypothetical protein [Opitutae bacterium]